MANCHFDPSVLLKYFDHYQPIYFSGSLYLSVPGQNKVVKVGLDGRILAELGRADTPVQVHVLIVFKYRVQL